MQSILEDLRKRIAAQLTEIDPQMELFSIAEKEQFERDRGSLQRRLAELPEEIAEEARLIRARYASPTPRLFSVSITYLVPERLAK